MALSMCLLRPIIENHGQRGFWGDLIEKEVKEWLQFFFKSSFSLSILLVPSRSHSTTKRCWSNSLCSNCNLLAYGNNVCFFVYFSSAHPRFVGDMANALHCFWACPLLLWLCWLYQNWIWKSGYRNKRQKFNFLCVYFVIILLHAIDLWRSL